MRKRIILFSFFIFIAITITHLLASKSLAQDQDCNINPTSISTKNIETKVNFAITLNENMQLGTGTNRARYKIKISDNYKKEDCRINDGECTEVILGENGQGIEVNDKQLVFSAQVSGVRRKLIDNNVVFQTELLNLNGINNCKPITIPVYEPSTGGSCLFYDQNNKDKTLTVNNNGEAVIKANTNQSDAPFRKQDTFHVSLVPCSDKNAERCLGTPVGEWGGHIGSACLTGKQLIDGFNTKIGLEKDVKYTVYIFNCGFVGPSGAIGEAELCRSTSLSTNNGLEPISPSGETSCPYCPKDTTWVSSTRKCIDKSGGEHDPLYDSPCGTGSVCKEGNTENPDKNIKSICSPLGNLVPKQSNEFIRNDLCPSSKIRNGRCTAIPSGLGVDLPTDVGGLINKLLGIFLGIVGGVAILIIIISGYRLMTSQGNPEKIQGARETLTSALVGFLFVIFSLVILQVIGYNILGIPGFGK